MIRPDAHAAWEDSEVRERLGWYYRVMTNNRPAKFLICKKRTTNLDLSTASVEELWHEHQRLSESFENLLREVRSGSLNIGGLSNPHQNFLDLKAELLRRMLKQCTLCEWNCGVNRTEPGKRGACKLASKSFVSTWFHHHGEEPPLVCSGGSGTVFFSGCTFRCAFCQNWDISQDPTSGAEVDGGTLSIIMKRMREEGVHNINFVGGDPTMHLHTIINGMKKLELNVPMLWNSNMYLSSDAMNILKDVIDIWLPDFKYGNDRCAIRLSKVQHYFDVVSRNHQIAYDNGDMIVRHLVLPDHLGCCTEPILKWIAEHLPKALVNIMDQYHPDNMVLQHPEKYLELTRRLRRDEIEKAYRIAERYRMIYKPVS